MPERPGVFRPLKHHVPAEHVPAEHWWILLHGMWTNQAELTGRRVVFAQCGSACWPNGAPPSTLLWCPACFPDHHALRDRAVDADGAGRFR
jgi:hypothetical protein